MVQADLETQLAVANAEIEKLRDRLKRTALRSSRRRSAVKQLQKAIAVQKFVNDHNAQWNETLRKQVDVLREEKGTAWRKQHEYLRNSVNSSPLWWRIWGKV